MIVRKVLTINIRHQYHIKVSEIKNDPRHCVALFLVLLLSTALGNAHPSVCPSVVFVFGQLIIYLCDQGVLVP